MNKLLVLAIASIFSTAFASAVLAEKTAFTADLKGPSEVPPTDSTGTGKAEVTYDDASKMLTWTITYSGLSGNATAAHFHGPAIEGENAGPMVPIKQLDSPMKGSATLTEDQSKALTGGKMYFNVHTAKYPDGEIRGQLAPAK
jgi:CHRD domain